MLSKDELRKAIEEGRISIGCPLPPGFTPMTKEDKEELHRVMIRIIEREKNNA